MLTPYLYPGESGGREDMRWCTFTHPDGAGLRIRALGDNLHFSALHASWQDLASAKYLHHV